MGSSYRLACNLHRLILVNVNRKGMLGYWELQNHQERCGTSSANAYWVPSWNPPHPWHWALPLPLVSTSTSVLDMAIYTRPGRNPRPFFRESLAPISKFWAGVSLQLAASWWRVCTPVTRNSGKSILWPFHVVLLRQEDFDFQQDINGGIPSK